MFLLGHYERVGVPPSLQCLSQSSNLEALNPILNPQSLNPESLRPQTLNLSVPSFRRGASRPTARTEAFRAKMIADPLREKKAGQIMVSRSMPEHDAKPSLYGMLMCQFGIGCRAEGLGQDCNTISGVCLCVKPGWHFSLFWKGVHVPREVLCQSILFKESEISGLSSDNSGCCSCFDL